MTAPDVTLVRANGIGFAVEEFGSGEPLVLLHGFTGSAGSWFSIAAELGSDYRVIAIDLIGHGRSDAPQDPGRYDIDLAPDDLDAIAAELDIDRAAWLGYSMGGRLALGLAMRRPRRVSALILESATPGIADIGERARRRAADEALARRIKDRGVEAFVSDWERHPLWQSQRALPPEIQRRQRELRLRNRATGLANSLRGMGQGAQPSHWDGLAGITIPVCLIAGALDAKFAAIAAQIAACIPLAELYVIPDAGHAVHLERPQQFTQIVGDFLARRGSLAVTLQQEIHR